MHHFASYLFEQIQDRQKDDEPMPNLCEEKFRPFAVVIDPPLPSVPIPTDRVILLVVVEHIEWGRIDQDESCEQGHEDQVQEKWQVIEDTAIAGPLMVQEAGTNRMPQKVVALGLHLRREKFKWNVLQISCMSDLTNELFVWRLVYNEGDFLIQTQSKEVGMLKTVS